MLAIAVIAVIAAVVTFDCSATSATMLCASKFAPPAPPVKLAITAVASPGGVIGLEGAGWGVSMPIFCLAVLALSPVPPVVPVPVPGGFG